MDRFTNTDVHTRRWNDVRREDGRTLELAPGESADLDLPTDFTDPYLARERVRPQPKGATPIPVPSAPDPDKE